MRVLQLYKIMDRITFDQFKAMELDRRVVIRKTVDGHVVSMDSKFRHEFRATFGLAHHQLGRVKENEIKLLQDESYGVPCHVILH